MASYSLVAAADSSEPLLRLSMQQALVMTIRGLAIALLPAGRQRAGPSSQGLTEAFAAELAGSPNALSEGRLRQYAGEGWSAGGWGATWGKWQTLQCVQLHHKLGHCEPPAFGFTSSLASPC